MDDEFEHRWLASPIYRLLQPGRIRSLLTELELAKRTKYHEIAAIVDHLTVEHVLPTSWGANWPLPDGTVPTTEQRSQAFVHVEEDDSPVGQIVRRNRLKDTIGNLTLLTQPLNSTVSNGDFKTKRDAIATHSKLELNREITMKEHWGEDEITARGRELFKVAASIWRVPTS